MLCVYNEHLTLEGVNVVEGIGCEVSSFRETYLEGVLWILYANFQRNKNFGVL